MAATKLPLEIQQQIFSMLDSKSFPNARGVCRYWRFASNGCLTLYQHLGRLPIRLAVELQHVNPRKLDLLFTQMAHRLMFGLVVSEGLSVAGALHPSCKLPVRPRTAASRDGKKSVALNDRTVTLFDTSGVSPVAIAQIQLHNFRNLPVGCPGLRPSASAQHQLALTSNGSLLAVAMDRTIQIYNLLDRGNCRVVTRHFADASTQRVARLDFDQNDHMLRIQLTGGGTVLYLGSPGIDGITATEFSYWNSDCGLKHTFMDSSRFSVATNLGDGIRFSGVQLIRSVGDGFLFAAQRRATAGRQAVDIC